MHDLNRTSRIIKIGEHIESRFGNRGHVFQQKGLTWECQDCDVKVVVDDNLQTWELSECIAFPCGDKTLSCEDMKRERISL